MALTVFQQKPLKHFVTISDVSWLSCLIFHFLLVFFPWSSNLAKLSPSLKKNLNLNVLIIAQYCYFLILTKLLKESCLISNSVNYNLHLDFDKNTSHALIHLTDKIRQQLEKLWLWNIYWLSRSIWYSLPWYPYSKMDLLWCKRYR